MALLNWSVKILNKKKTLARTHQKILLAMAKDIRVVLVKLLDRVHNMRTLEFQTPEKQVKIAQETMDLYSPLAHRLGMYRIKLELEDTAFRYLHPEEYKALTEQITKQRLLEKKISVRWNTESKSLLKTNNI